MDIYGIPSTLLVSGCFWWMSNWQHWSKAGPGEWRQFWNPEAKSREIVLGVLKMNSMDHRGSLSIQFWRYFSFYSCRLEHWQDTLITQRNASIQRKPLPHRLLFFSRLGPQGICEELRVHQDVRFKWKTFEARLSRRNVAALEASSKTRAGRACAKIGHKSLGPSRSIGSQMFTDVHRACSTVSMGKGPGWAHLVLLLASVAVGTVHPTCFPCYPPISSRLYHFPVASRNFKWS